MSASPMTLSTSSPSRCTLLFELGWQGSDVRTRQGAVQDSAQQGLSRPQRSLPQRQGRPPAQDEASCCKFSTQVLCRPHNAELQCIRCALHACPSGPGGYEASGLGRPNTGGQGLAESTMAA